MSVLGGSCHRWIVTAALQRANECLVDAAFVSMECVRVVPTSLAWNIVLMVEVWIFGGLISNIVWWFDVAAVCVRVSGCGVNTWSCSGHDHSQLEYRRLAGG